VDFDADPRRDYAIAIDGVNGATGEATLNVKLYTDPVIFEQPANVDATEGDNATFSVGAIGKRPLTYQWQYKGSNLPNETGPSLTVRAVTKAQAGPYRAIVRNTYGEINSAGAILNVLARPKIAQQPVGAVVDAGEAYTFNVKAFGENPLLYQWYFKATADAAPVALPDGTADSLPLVNLSTDEGGFYLVSVTNVAGSVTSDAAKLVVTPTPPKILEALTNRTVVEGTDVSFDAKVKGYQPMSFQWFKNGQPIPGETERTLVFLAALTNDSGL
jgi:hypothetical protein